LLDSKKSNPIPFPFGTLCDAYLAKPPPSSLALNNNLGDNSNSGEAWYPVIVECTHSLESREQIYRVRFIGFEYVTLVPLSHLRPLSIEFSKSLENIK
jgi:hypothetical protein